MPRKKKCPNCGSNKVRKEGREWICRICGKTWSGKTKRTRTKKGKIRFGR